MERVNGIGGLFFGAHDPAAIARLKILATMFIYRDEHDRAATQRTLADVVAGALGG